MTKENTIHLTYANAELITQEVADLLNVSHPFLVNLIEQGIV